LAVRRNLFRQATSCGTRTAQALTTLPKRATFSAACFRQADERHEEGRGNSKPDYVCADFDNDGCKGSKRHPHFSLLKVNVIARNDKIMEYQATMPVAFKAKQ
jgi:hypothetical protein